MVASILDHFKTLMWKCLILELDSRSKYIYNILIVIVVGVVFGMTASNFNKMEYIQALIAVFLFLQCGFVGRMIALNLVRDRKIKFRLTLQLIGVRQRVYMAANIMFTILYGLIQMLFLLLCIFIFASIFKVSQISGQTTGSFEFNIGSFLEFFFNSTLFLLAYLAMCAAFSGLIHQYDFAADIVSKFTFITIFVPLAYVVSTLISTLSKSDPDNLTSIARLNWYFIWLPNVTFLNTACKMIIDPLIKDDPRIKTDSGYLFALVMICQFVGYLTVYYFIDRFISTDTGAQRQFLATAPSQIKEDAADVSSDNLLTATDNTLDGQTSLKIRNLSKNFGNFTALNDVSLDLTPNHITCLLGHNGAGKTTLIDIITGFQAPSKGGIYLNGSNIHSNPELLYGKVGYASSHDPLFEEITVYDFLNLIARLKGCQEPTQEAFKVANETHLQPHMQKKIRECSGGTKRRVSIAASLIGEPSLIFLDEPSTGVDPENRRALWEAIAAMKKPERIIMITTHHLEEAEFLSRDVIILSKGEVSIRGSPDSIKEELGVGYKFTINGLGGQESSRLMASVSYLQQYLSIADHRLQTIGEIEVTLKKNSEDVILGVISALNDGGFKYNIQASTLEDAFINLGEAAEAHSAGAEREQIINTIFSKKFETNLPNKLAALLVRKLYLLFRSMHQVIVIMLLVLIPTFTYYLIANFIYSNQNRYRTPDDQLLNKATYFTVVNILCIIYYSFTCGFFGITPVTERVGRIRYLMKMNNVSCLQYFPTLLVPDIAISLGLIVITYTLSYMLTYSITESIKINIIFMLGLNLFLWMVTFIVQSYCISFLFSNKEKAVKYLPSMLLLANLASTQVIAFVVNSIKNYEIILNVLMRVMFTLFPIYPNLKFCIDVIDKRESDFEVSLITETMIHSLICFVLFMALAIFLDYNNTKITGSDNRPVVQPENTNIFDRVTVDQEAVDAHRETSEYPLQVRGVFKMFNNGFYALSNVNAVLRKGEILGLIGPNGAGKSTMFNIVSNFMSPTAGNIKYNGRELKYIPEFYDSTGLCAQDDIIWPELSVDQHLNFYGHLKGVDPVTIAQWKQLMGLGGFGSFSSINLSTGMKRKLCYIISMMSNPIYKFLDEPTSGLDPVSRKLMRTLITAQKRIYGGSCVFTTHTMKDAEDLCDRVAILINGKLATVDTVNNLRNKTGGLNVSFHINLATTDTAGEYNYLAGLFMQVFPECLEYGQPVVTDNSERRVVFFAPNLNEMTLVNKMKTLYDLKRKGQIADFEISQRSLEDLFLYLARFQQRRLV